VAGAELVLAGEDVPGLGDVLDAVGVGDAPGDGAVVAYDGVPAGVDEVHGPLVAGEEARPKGACAEAARPEAARPEAARPEAARPEEACADVAAAGALRAPAAVWPRPACDRLLVAVRAKPAVALAPSSPATITAAASGRQRFLGRCRGGWFSRRGG
jgi:hypothetical protein